MRKSIIGILCIFFAFICTTRIFAQSVYVPLSSSVYDFIDRFEAKGILDRSLTGTKPLSRIEVSHLLAIIRDERENNNRLSKVEDDMLQYFLQEFWEELESHDLVIKTEQARSKEWISRLEKVLPFEPYKNGINLFSHRNEDFSLYLDPIFNLDISLNDADSMRSTDRVNRYLSGVRFRGIVGDKLGFYFDMRNTREWGSRDYPEGIKVTSPGLGYAKNFGTYQYHDETLAYVILKISPLELEFGKNVNRWGPGYRGGLLLSNTATSYDQVKIKLGRNRFKYVTMLGFLKAYPQIVESVTGFGDNVKIKYANKYIAAHRLEVNVFKGVDIGLHEAVIYGQRAIEPGYLNPVMFLRSAEHYLGDPDNALMGADIELCLINGLKIYSELLIDDIFTTRLGTNWYGNKLGFVTGALWIDPFGFSDSSVRLEYSRIRPFVYTHKYPINVYKHFDTGLGHPNGPNSDELLIRIVRNFTRRLKLACEFSYRRHGANPPDINIGGDINRPHKDGAVSDYIGFLEGEVEKVRSLYLDFSYECLRELFIDAKINIHTGDGFRINNLANQSFDSRKFYFGLKLNY